MVLPPSLQSAIEEEINREVNERITKVLEMISKTYNIKYARLLKDYANMETSTETASTTCCGLTKAGKRCQRSGKFDGFCKAHLSQKPDVRVTRSSAMSPPKVTHTHTLPPLFMKGCPACEKSKSSSACVLRS